MNILNSITLATETAISSPGIILTILTSVGAGVASVWGWFRGELSDCKKDRKELFARVEELHKEVSALSMRVGQVEQKPKAT